ncbi:MAG: pilus assembly protein [bacterium]|nr:pilus assembly protein [bacterium]
MITDKKVEGSITVEAAFVIPIIVVILMALIYFSFYLHDQTVVACVIDEANERLNQAVRQPTNYETGEISYEQLTSQSLLCRVNGDYSVEIDSMRKFIKDRLNKRLMIGEIETIDIKKEQTLITTTVTAKNRIHFFPALEYLKDYHVSVNAADCEVNNASEYVRAASVTLDVVSQTKAFDKVADVINKIDKVLK